MDNWERFNETSLPSKESFYSNLNMEDIDDIDYRHFRDMCLKEYELDPAHFLLLPGLAWQARLKKTNIELELLTDYVTQYTDMLKRTINT